MCERSWLPLFWQCNGNLWHDRTIVSTYIYVFHCLVWIGVLVLHHVFDRLSISVFVGDFSSTRNHRKPGPELFALGNTLAPHGHKVAPRCSRRPPKSFVNAVPGKPHWHSHSQPPVKILWSATLLPLVPVKKLRIGSWEENLRTTVAVIFMFFFLEGTKVSATIGPYFICFFFLAIDWNHCVEKILARYMRQICSWSDPSFCMYNREWLYTPDLASFLFSFHLSATCFLFFSLSLFPFPFTLKCFFHFRDSLPLFSPVFLSPVAIAVGRTLAIDLLSQIPPSPVSTTIFTFGSCINACAMTGEWQVALKLLGQLKDARCWGFWWSLLSGGKSGSVPMFFCPSRNMQHVQPRLRYPYFRRHSYGRWLHS